MEWNSVMVILAFQAVSWTSQLQAITAVAFFSRNFDFYVFNLFRTVQLPWTTLLYSVHISYCSFLLLIIVFFLVLFLCHFWMLFAWINKRYILVPTWWERGSEGVKKGSGGLPLLSCDADIDCITVNQNRNSPPYRGRVHLYVSVLSL